MRRIRTRADAAKAFVGPAALLVLTCALGVLVGPALSWAEIFTWHPSTVAGVILWELRLPRVVTAILVGACLAASGAVIQGLLRNPLAGPEVLGVSAGAGAGALVLLVLAPVLWGVSSLVLGALLGAALTATAVFALATSRRLTHLTSVILAGMALSSLLSAVSTLLLLSSYATQVNQFLFWLVGSLENRRWTHVLTVLPAAVIALPVMFAVSGKLNVLAFGEQTARSLGLRVQPLKILLLSCVVVATAGAVSVSGAIGFLGLLVPHAVRLWWGPDARWHVALSALWGAVFLVTSDAVVRLVFSPLEVPVGIFTSVLGAPFFLMLLLRSHRTARDKRPS